MTSVYNAGGTTLTAALVGASTSQAGTALTQIAGDEAPVFRQIAARRTGQFQDVVAQRLASGGAASSDPSTANDLWVSGDYSHAHQSGDDGLGSSAYSEQSARVTLGFDRAVSPSVRAGAAIALNDDTIQFTDRSADARSDGAQVLVYGGWQPQQGPFYVNGMAGAGYWDNSLTRSVTLGTLSGTASGSFHTAATAIYVESGFNLPLTYGTWQPYAALRAAHYMQQGFAEHGGGVFDLDYASANSNAVSSVLGVRFTKRAGTLFSRPLDWRASIAWEHLFGSASQSLNASLVDAPSSTYQVFGSPTSRDIGRASVGVDWHWGPLTTVFARVGGDVGSKEHDYGVLAGAQWKW